MVVVKVELWPNGHEEHAKELTRAYITNNGITSKETNGEFGSYEAKFMQSYQFNPKKIWKKSTVHRIHRERRGIWDILFASLFNAGLAKRNFDVMNPAAIKKNLPPV